MKVPIIAPITAISRAKPRMIESGSPMKKTCICGISRDNTPSHARFVGPPGPKTFRLWSRRELAFNRAASPYHAAGLADWSQRFRDHVGFDGSITEFAAAYLKDRLKLEHGFDRMNSEQLASLARKEGASFVLAGSKTMVGDSLERLRAEGRFAIYRVLPKPQESARIASNKPRM